METLAVADGDAGAFLAAMLHGEEGEVGLDRRVVGSAVDTDHPAGFAQIRRAVGGGWFVRRTQAQSQSRLFRYVFPRAGILAGPALSG